MLLHRAVEERTHNLYRQGKIPGSFYDGLGQEAIPTGITYALTSRDRITPHHRDMGAHLVRGTEPSRIFGQFMARAGGVTEGRDSNTSFGDPDRGCVGHVSHLGDMVSVAVGIASAIKLRGQHRCVATFFGDGATSRGDMHEAMNWAGVHQLPVLFVLEDNGFAYSTPTARQFAVHPVERAAGYGFPGVEVDGNDVEAVFEAAHAARQRAITGEGPTLISCKTMRMHGHGAHDDMSYVPDGLLEEWAERDPIAIQSARLGDLGVDLEPVELGVAELIDAETEIALAMEIPSGDTPRPVFATSPHLLGDEAPDLGVDTTRSSGMAELTYLQALTSGLRESMRDDPAVYCLGQDIGVFGGAFKVTEGLIDEFGADRVLDTPISEAAMVGAAVGAALEGFRPVVEFQFADFVSCGFDQLVNVAGKMFYRQRLSVSMTARLPSGGGFSGGPFHSQNPEAWFMHAPGMKIVAPSTPEDAKGLLIAAIRDENQVIFMEHKHLYRRVKGEVPEGIYETPFGARLVREGTDLTVLAYGAMVQSAAEAAERIEDASIEVIDIRSLAPLDEDAILASVAKTSKVIIVDEAPLTCAVGAQVASLLAEKAFGDLDGPITRVAAQLGAAAARSGLRRDGPGGRTGDVRNRLAAHASQRAVGGRRPVLGQLRVGDNHSCRAQLHRRRAFSADAGVGADDPGRLAVPGHGPMVALGVPGVGHSGHGPRVERVFRRLRGPPYEQRRGRSVSGAQRMVGGAQAPKPSTPGREDSLLSIKDLTVATAGPAPTYPLQHVDLGIPRGSFVGLVGESGSGKSMTSLAVLGMLPSGLSAVGGAVTFDGRDLLGLSEREMRRVRGDQISIVFQNPKSSLNPVMKIGDQIAELMRLHEGLGKRAARAAAIDLLDGMGIPDAARRAEEYPHQYSGGMAQRAALARAMACSPRLLIADEPTTGLDATVQEEVLDLLVRSVRERDASLLLVSHDMRVIEAVCDHTVVMYAGMVLEAGPTHAVLGSPLSPYTGALLDCFEVSGRGLVKSIPGSAPIILEEHTGCPFAARCALVEERCTESVPLLRDRDRRRVACHLR